MAQSDVVESVAHVTAEESPSLGVSLKDRRSPELVIGFVGPVGSGVSTTAERLSKILEQDYGYQVKEYHVSSLIAENAKMAGKEYNSTLEGADRISELQSIGNELRNRFSSNYLIEKCIEKIAVDRLEGGYDTNQNPHVPLPLRRAHIIDSLKNPAEAELLRDVYGEIFWLIAVFAPETVRRDRLLGKGVKRANLDSVITRDEDEDLDFGQKVRDTSQLADFFIRNDASNDSKLIKTLDRYLGILFNTSVSTPTIHEAAMYNAVSSAAKSACLSRQVGAAIYSESGELIGVGWNDVPKFGGGLYIEKDDDYDHRCYKWGGKICHNDSRKDGLYKEITRILKKKKIIKEETSFLELKKVLVKTEIKNLVEYSRSVHAEMEAIISVARGNKAGLIGAIMYTTTFPCHNCARHIVASGISEVIYIEPYPKSLASELHSDSIATKSGEKSKKVEFLQYHGVAPKNIIRLFKHGIERKENGKLVEIEKTTAEPVFQPALDGFTIHEQMIVKEVMNKEKTAEIVSE